MCFYVKRLFHVPGAKSDIFHKTNCDTHCNLRAISASVPLKHRFVFYRNGIISILLRFQSMKFCWPVKSIRYEFFGDILELTLLVICY